MSFVSSRHFVLIPGIIKYHLIDFTCELTITESDMANITLSCLRSTHHSLMTGNVYMLENKQWPSHDWMSIRNTHYTPVETSVMRVGLLHQHHFSTLQSAPIPSLHTSMPPVSVLIPRANHSCPPHSASQRNQYSLTSCLLTLRGFYNSSFYRYILGWKL